ncbi:MAG: c-type cytochrome, partial [Gammaproteobacteria bacterium]|nr:c-type cytochrome [Gammaproteobacteria bacterium]
LLTLASLLVPMVHFVLSPLLFIAGPVLAWQQYKLRQQSLAAEGECPLCHQSIRIELEAHSRLPHWNTCPHCNNPVQLVLSATTAAKPENSNSQQFITIMCLSLIMLWGDPVSARNFHDYAATTNNIVPVAESPPVTSELIEYGGWLYRGLCTRCHGVEGDGNGADWQLTEFNPQFWLPRKPRDFTEAIFKLRSRPSGSLPTDRDLFIAISRGLVANEDMPAFAFLPERDRWALVAYIKRFSDRWEEEKEDQEPTISIVKPPLPDVQMLTAGHDVYQLMKCAKCHGEQGLGDGPSAPQLEDDNGLPIAPRDFTNAGKFAGGSDPQSIYQTFTTGFDGTPMPSYADFLEEEERWQLVWYVMSLRKDWDLEATRRALQNNTASRVKQP